MNIEIEGLPRGIRACGGRDQNKYPGARNRTRFNQDRTRFVSAIHIHEVSMGANFGTLIWGRKRFGKWWKTGRLRTIRTFCNGPFAKWINDQCFISRIHDSGSAFLCLSIDADKGFRLSKKGASVEDVLSMAPDGEWVKSERKLAAVLKERQTP